MGQCFLHGKSGGGLNKSIIIVTDLPTGSTVTATKGEEIKTAIEKNGEWWIKNLDLGKWTLKATLDNQSATTTFNIERVSVYRVSMTYRLTPEFSYTGEYKVVDDDDQPIEDFASWKGNWKVMFNTSGELEPINMYGFDGKIDVFCVAGAGGPNPVYNQWSGSHGGETKTGNHTLLTWKKYDIVIGSRGEKGLSGGNTSAFGITVTGGAIGHGNSDSVWDIPGVKEFDGNTTSDLLYSGTLERPGTVRENSGTGNVCDGGTINYGASGIVIIRNAREVA